MKEAEIKYRDFIIKDILIDAAPLKQIEITIITDKLILKNYYLPYFPNIHDKLFSRKVALKDKMEVFWEDVFRIIDWAKETTPSKFENLGFSFKK